MVFYLPEKRCAWPADYLNNRQVDLKQWTRSLSIYAGGLRNMGYSDEARQLKLSHVAIFLFRGEITEDHYKYGGSDILHGVLAYLLKRDAENFHRELNQWMTDIGAAYALQIMQGQDISGLDQILHLQTQTHHAEEILANPNLEHAMEAAEDLYCRGLDALPANDPRRSFLTFDRDILDIVKSALRSDPTHMVLGDRCVCRVRLSTVAETTGGPDRCKWFSTFDMENAAFMSIPEQLSELSAIKKFTNRYNEVRMATEEAIDWLNSANRINGAEVEIVEWINGTSQRPHRPGPATMWPY